MNKKKFRFWDKTQGRYRDNLALSENGAILMLNEHQDWEIYRGKKQFVVEQYTGLQDKNGKDVYEGDIVELKAGNYCERFVVEYDCGGFTPFVDMVGQFNREELCDAVSAGDYEVVGNIHENPELLAEK